MNAKGPATFSRAAEKSGLSPICLAPRLPAGATVCVGLSGGVDSVTLLDALVQDGSHRVSAVHVHHGLSPNADSWAEFCAALCKQRGVDLAIERVRVDRGAAEGIEAAARAQRYAVFARRRESHVALAHHLDDQAETVLLQLLRGAGLKGACAMPPLRRLPGSDVTVYRPLLGASRAALVAHARARGLEWIEDESNASARFDRNYLRHSIAPLLEARFPGWSERLARFARHAGSAQELLDELGRSDGAGESGLLVNPSLSDPRRANALRAFLWMNALPMPGETRLAEMAKQLYGARADARVRIEHAGVALVRQRDVVRIDAGRTLGGWRVEWHGEGEVDLGDGRGAVRFEPAKGRGILASLAAGTDWCFMPRAGGEKMRLDARGPTRTLKNLLQERDVPEWQRDRLPLLFKGPALVWVPGVGIAAEFACPRGAEGIFPRWEVAGTGFAVLE